MSISIELDLRSSYFYSYFFKKKINHENCINLLHYTLKPGLEIFDISSIYRISVIFDMILAIDNRLMEKSAKKSVISAIYLQYIGFGPIYRGNIGSMAHAHVNLIF